MGFDVRAGDGAVGKQVTPRFQPWQVWWADLDPIEGHEQGGRRPVLIVSSLFQLQLTRFSLATVLPLTTRQRPGWEHHRPLQLPGQPMSYVVTEQIRTLTSTRISGKAPLAVLAPQQIADIRPALAAMIDLA